MTATDRNAKHGHPSKVSLCYEAVVTTRVAGPWQAQAWPQRPTGRQSRGGPLGPEPWRRWTGGGGVPATSQLPGCVLDSSRHFPSSANTRSGSHSARHLAKCQFCTKTFRGESQRCLKHVNECTQIPAHKKEEYLDAVQSSNKKQKVGLTSAEEITEVLKDDDDETLILKGVIAKNIPFRSLYDNVHIKEYLRRHGLHLQHRDTARGRVEDLYKEYRRRVERKLDDYRCCRELTLMLDGSDDVSRNSIYLFMLASRKEAFMMKLIDVSSASHTTDFLLGKIDVVLEEWSLSLANILACTTDNPTTMKSLREKLSTKNVGIASVPCALHVLNSLTKDLLNEKSTVELIQCFSETFHRVASMVSYAHRSYRWNAAMKKEIENNPNIKQEIAAFFKVRWYTAAKVAQGVDRFASLFKSLIVRGESKEEDFPQPDANIINHFTDECLYFWNAVLAKFLGAIADSIANLQHKQATVDQILINFLHLDWKFRKFVEEEGLLTVEQGLAVMKLLSDRCLTYCSTDFLFVLSLLLHPQFKRTAMTSKTWELSSAEQVLQQVFKFLHQNEWYAELYRQEEVPTMIKELVQYININAATTQSSFREFWQDNSVQFPLLQRLALRLMDIKPHTAVAEGMFSSLHLIKTKSRNRLEVEKVNQMGFLQVEMFKEVLSFPAQPRVSSFSINSGFTLDANDEEYVFSDKSDSVPDSDFYQEETQSEKGVNPMDILPSGSRPYAT
eukprot:scaffold14720_cov172-Ochromonas_danica.AAC.2